MRIATLILCIVIGLVACHRSPEKLPRFKREFKSQITNFEQQKIKTDKKIEEGVVELSGLEKALEEAKNVDREFNQVYGNWKQVNRQVENLYRDYEKLKTDANNLFSAMEDQTASIRDQNSKAQLMSAIGKIKGDYNVNLQRTEKAVSNLKSLHTDAVDIIKGLEVAVALGQIAQINTGLDNIEEKVGAIMAELNISIEESKALYDERIGNF